MGFYGNSLAASSAAKTQFTFDRIYSNRYEMDYNCLNDGVYIGRYILIDYGIDDEYCGIQVYEKDGLLYSSSNCAPSTRLVYTTNAELSNSEVHSSDIVWTMETVGDKVQKVFYICTGYVPGEAIPYATFRIITTRDQGEGYYYTNYQIDLAAYTTNNNGRGYDSTVWQKVYSEGKEYYINVAELNGVVPTFSLTYDAPTTYPIAPHFDMSSTNTMYKMHMQPQWGFKVKHADASGSLDSWSSTDDTVYKSDTMIEYSDESYYEAFLSIGNQPEGATYPNFVNNPGGAYHYKYPGAIYYNKKGFDPEIRSYDETTEDQITILPTGCSGQMYNTHDANPLDSKSRPDTQELVMMLPSVGNAVSKIWDILYGDEELTGPMRNLDVNWDSTGGLRMVYSAGGDEYTYESDAMRTVAGCINTVHDLIGMIIVGDKMSPEATEKEHEEFLNQAAFDKIYYREGKYQYKDIGYTYTKLDDPSSVLGQDAVYREVDVDDFYVAPTKYVKDVNNYIAQKEYDAGAHFYKVTHGAPVDLEEAGFEPYKYYQHISNGDLILGKDVNFIDGAQYSEVSEVTQVTNPPETETWEEINAPTYFYRSNHSNWYYKKTDNKGVATYYRALEGSPQQFKGSDGTMQNYPYYIINPTQGNTGYITDESGNLIPVMGLDINNAKRINVVKYDPNVSYYTLTPNSAELDENYNTLERDQKALPHSFTKLQRERDIKDNQVYYTLTETPKKAFYRGSIYYQLMNNATDSNLTDYILATDPKPKEGMKYYNITVEEPWNLTYFYEPGKYYYTRDNNTYAPDYGEYITSGRKYYVRDAVYVMPESTNLNYPIGTEWNSYATEIPPNVVLGTREQHYVWKTLSGFGRTLNTIHGLILQINRIMQFGNTETRDETTVAGLMNKMKDIISKFGVLIPNRPMVVNQYASMASADMVTNDWISASVDGTPDNEKFNITHLYPHKKADSTSTYNVNGNGNTIVLETLERDNAGHVTKVNQNTVTLPYGFKNIGTNGVSTAVTELGLPNSAVTIVADGTQATFNINSANKWMRIANTDGTSNIVAIGHALSAVSANAHTEYGLKQNETVTTLDADNIFEVPSFKFDEAGHIVEANTRTVALPENFSTVTTTVSDVANVNSEKGTAGSLEADSVVDTITLAEGNRWINIAADKNNDKITFSHYVKQFVESPDSTDLDSQQTFAVQELTWDSAGHITASTKRTYTLNDGIKTVNVTNSGNTNAAVNAIAENASLTAVSHVDNITLDAGNRWITLIGKTSDSGDKTVTVHHASAGSAVNTQGVTADQTPQFGGSFKVLEASVDAAGHVSALKSHTITLPKGQLDGFTANGYSVLTSISMNANSGVITQTNAPVGSLKLFGYEEGTDNGIVVSTDSINSAFAKLQNQIQKESTDRVAAIEALDYTDTPNDNKAVTKVSEANGIISVERQNITSLKLDGYTTTTETTDIAATDTLGKALALLQSQITANETALTVLTDGVKPDEVDGVKDLLDWVKDHEANEVKAILDNIADLQNRAMPSYEDLADDEIYLMKKTANGVEWVKMAQWTGKEY